MKNILQEIQESIIQNRYSSMLSVYSNLSQIAKDNPDLADEVFETYRLALQSDKNDERSLRSAYIFLYNIARVCPDLADKIVDIYQLELKSDKNDADNLGLIYEILAQIVKANPNLADKVFKIYQENIIPRTHSYYIHQLSFGKDIQHLPVLQDCKVRAAYAHLKCAYKGLSDLIILNPNMADNVFKSFQTILESDKHNLCNLHFTYLNSLPLLKQEPKYADKIFDICQIILKSDKYNNNLRQIYKNLAQIAEANPDLTDKVLETYKTVLQSDKNNENSLQSAYHFLYNISKVCPDLADKIFETYKIAFQSDKNNTHSLGDAYTNLASIIKAKPELIDKIINEITVDTTVQDSLLLLGSIIDKREDLTPELTKKYPDVDVKTLKLAYKIYKPIELNKKNDWDDNYSDDTDTYYQNNIKVCYKKLQELPIENQKKVARVLTTEQLDTESKQIIYKMFLEDELPIKDVADFNPSVYNEIKEYMLSKESKAHPELSKEEVYERNKEWLIQSAIYVAVLYKKNYKQYFDVIEKYNVQLPKLKAMMPEVLYEVQEKEEKLSVELNAIQEERKKYDTREHGLTSTDAGYQEMRAKHNELGLKERGIKGYLRGVQGYIDYEELQPIGMEKATAWMQKAIKIKDRERLLKKINSSLLGTNPNILACGRRGQPFIRLDHPTANFDDAIIYIEKIDELMLVSSRWNTIPDEIKIKSFKDIVEAAKIYKFNGENIEFMNANGKYIENQKIYDKAEAIYEQGRLTPSRFEKKEYYSEDGNWRCYIADKDDPRPLYAGGMWQDRAKCCQSYGSQGSSCAVDSVLNPDSGCVIFERKTIVKDENGNDQEAWEMQGCSWCYEVQSGEYKKLIFDNVEINDKYVIYEQKAINQAFDAMVEDLGKENYSEIRMGHSPDLRRTEDKIAKIRDGLPHGYKGCSDASTQYILYKNEEATPEKLPEIMIVGMDLAKHRKGMEEVAREAFPEGSQDLEIPSDAKGMVLINRDNKVLGYVVWTEKAQEEHKGEKVSNWIYDMAVLPQHQGKDGSFKLLTEMMKHVQKIGGTWGGELRDTTSLRFMVIMSDKVENGEIAEISKDFRGRAKVDLEIVGLDHEMQADKEGGAPSKVYRCIFKPLSQEETEQRLQARKVENIANHAREKIETKHQEKQTTSNVATPSVITKSDNTTKSNISHDDR